MRTNNETMLKTFEEADQVLFKIAALKLTIERDENDMNTIIQDVKKRYEAPIKELKDKVAAFEKMLEDFAKFNKKDFSTVRSKALTYGKIGFRAGKDALKIINAKKFTWDRVRESLQNLFGAKYVDVKVTINKTKIIADAQKGALTDEKLEAAGIKISKTERFFYDINFEQIKLEETKS